MDDSKIPMISRDELKTRLDRGDDLTLVEALPPPAYRDGHIPGAINISLGVFETDIANVNLEKDAWIITYCT